MSQYVVLSSVSGVNAGKGDTVIVASGGTDTNYIVSLGGEIIAEDGGTLSGGQFLFVDDPPLYPMLPNQEIILSGGLAIGTSVEDGEQTVSGGTTIGTVVAGYSTNLIPPGDSSGEQIVANGGVAIDTAVEPTLPYLNSYPLQNATFVNAQQIVESGAVSMQTNLSGVGNYYYTGEIPPVAYAPENAIAIETVDSGGNASDTTIGFDSEEFVSSGGSIGGTTKITGITESFSYIGSITHSILELNGPAGSGTIDFVHSAGELIVNGTTMPTNEIVNIGSNSLIDLTSVPESSVTGVVANAYQLTVETTSGDFTLNVQDANSREYIVANDGQGGTELLCFLRGTRILTPTGERPVEDLRIGDVVVTRYSGLQEIRWIGRQSYTGWFLQNNPHKQPVRIVAGALGEDLPARDLGVSPGHSMLLQTEAGEERLVLASSLINGITITQDEVPDEVHYFQLDLKHHDCVIAEGTWSETYGDGDQLRGQFHNVGEFWELYPDHREPDELTLCAPRPERGPKLDQALRPVVQRAMAGLVPGRLSGCIDLIPTPWKVEGWAYDADHPDLPVLLEVLLRDEPIGTVLACDHRSDLEQAGVGRGRCAFAFSSPVRLPLEAMHQIRVRRLSDGAEIIMSAACHDHIDREYATQGQLRQA